MKLALIEAATKVGYSVNKEKFVGSLDIGSSVDIGRYSRKIKIGVSSEVAP